MYESIVFMPEHQRHDFNYYIVRFFLNNGRLTFLLFALVVVIGSVATLSLRTTGFPNPSLDAVSIFTRYPGASSQSVLNDVTVPIENAIKTVDGIAGYESTSSNETSVIFVTFESGSDVNTVKTELSSAVDSASLPSEIDEPIIDEPDISGPDFVFTIVNADGDNESLYNTIADFRSNVENLDQTAQFEVVNPITAVVSIQPDFQALGSRNISPQDLQTQLATFGQQTPIGSDITIDDQSTSISATFGETSLDQLRSFPIASGSQQDLSFAPLSELATINVTYDYDTNPIYVGLDVDGERVTVPGVVVNVKAVENTDQAGYDSEIIAINEELNSAQYKFADQVNSGDLDQTLVLRNYAVNDENQQQVEEVVQGLFGGPLELENTIVAQIGWIFGALQLVFVTMFIFVSWRAAIISALAIPLSLSFTSIYLFFIGESFNTLVLFSLVLVIGLVVDPTLVVLEAIQRKLDSGLKGKQAVLAGIDDVGIGLFASTITNVIVFLPFGLISGVIGDIFSYIPLTIVPAIVGSYIVALIFLSWFGGIFLKRNQGASDSEEENLWAIAKYLINLNKSILHSRRIYRVLIIVVTFVLSIGLTAGLFSLRAVEQTDFSSPSDSPIIIASTTLTPTVSEEQRNTLREQFVNDLLSYQGVSQVFPVSGSNTYFIELIERENDNRDVSTEIARRMSDELFTKYQDSFFSIDISSSGPGGPTQEFPIQIGIYPQSETDNKAAALNVRETLQSICVINGVYSIEESCDGGQRPITQVNDGFTNLENRLIQIQADRESLLTSGIANYSSNQEQNLLSSIRGSIITNTDAEVPASFRTVTEVLLGDELVNVVIDFPQTDQDSIQSVEELSNLPIQSQTNPTNSVELESVASLETITPQDSISRINGSTIVTVQAKATEEFSDQGSIQSIQQTVFDYYSNNEGERALSLGLEEDGVRAVVSSAGPDFAQSFQELITALLLAIIIIYTILVIFFKSFSKPLIILYTIPLAFIGLMPGLAFLGGGQLGFLEIIGMIILVGLVVNVALYLIDSARSYMLVLGYDQKKAIATASGIRLRSVVLTTITAIASLAPLAIYSEFYRSIAIVIMFGLATSGLTSLITTPILYVFFNWLSDLYHKFNPINKIVFLSPITITIPLALILGFTIGFENQATIAALGITALTSMLITVVYLIVFWFKTPKENIKSESIKAPKHNKTKKSA